MSLHPKLSQLVTRLAINHQEKTLYLVCQNLTAEDIRELVNLVAHNQHIKRINLAKNKLGAESCRYLAKLLLNMPALKYLELSQNNIRDSGIQLLTDALCKNVPLESLDVSANEVGDRGAKYLAKMLRCNQTLKHLNLAHNAFTEKGMRCLAQGCHENHSLQYVDCSHNRLGSSGSMILLGGLINSPNLKVLLLTDNYIDDGAIKYLAAILHHNKTIEELNLSCNDINDQGAQYIAAALKNNQHLRKLDLSHNRITDTGAICITQTLEENYFLQELDIRGNAVSAVIENEMKQIIERNKKYHKQFHEIFELSQSHSQIFANQLQLSEYLSASLHAKRLTHCGYPGAKQVLDNLQLKIGMAYAYQQDMAGAWAILEPLTKIQGSQANNVLASALLEMDNNENLENVKRYKLCLLLLREAEPSSLRDHLIVKVFVKLQQQICAVPYVTLVEGAPMPSSREIIGARRIITIDNLRAAIDAAQELIRVIVKMAPQKFIKIGDKRILLLQQVKAQLAHYSPTEIQQVTKNFFVQQGLLKLYGTTEISLIEHLILYPHSFPVSARCKQQELDQVIEHIDTSVDLPSLTHLKKELLDKFHKDHFEELTLASHFLILFDLIFKHSQILDEQCVDEVKAIYLANTSLSEKSIDLFNYLLFILEQDLSDKHSQEWILMQLAILFGQNTLVPDCLERIKTCVNQISQNVVKERLFTRWQLRRMHAAFDKIKKESSSFNIIRNFSLRKHHNVLCAMDKEENSCERYGILMQSLQQESKNDSYFNDILIHEFNIPVASHF